MKILTKIVVAVTIFTLLLLNNSLKINAISNAGLSLLPANVREEEERSSQIFIHQISPGETIEDEILISNINAEDKEILVYSADSLLNNDGQLSCKQYIEKKVEEGSWINISQEKHTVKANSEKKVKFSITVPETTSVGEHNACIVMQTVDNKVAETEAGIGLRIRIALRVLITVPGDKIIRARFDEFSHAARSQTDFLKPEITNIGNVTVQGDLVVNTKFFNFYKEAELSENISIPVTSKLSKELKVKYRFYGGLYKAQASFNYVDENNDSHKIISSIWYWQWPAWWFILIIILVILSPLALLYKKK